jgi:hypothetical protein
MTFCRRGVGPLSTITSDPQHRSIPTGTLPPVADAYGGSAYQLSGRRSAVAPAGVRLVAATLWLAAAICLVVLVIGVVAGRHLSTAASAVPASDPAGALYAIRLTLRPRSVRRRPRRPHRPTRTSESRPTGATSSRAT